VVANDGDAAEIADVVDWFDGLPACWIALEPAPGLAERLVAAGCRAESGGVEMGATLEGLRLPPAPADVEVAEVAEATAAEWLDVAEACGWINDPADRTPRRLVLTATGPEVVAYVARRGGRAVGMARALYLPPTVCLLDVAVLNDERRRGVGGALAAVRLEEARARGCTQAVLSPSADGEGLYRSLGFEVSATAPGRWFYLPVSPGGP
jgi:GNAT superfamily N-acetyltransferase